MKDKFSSLNNMPGHVTKAIILAGGLGTRLRSAVPDLPKCMAPVNGVPFISYVISHFMKQGIRDFIFALGYKSEQLESCISTILPESDFRISMEPDPMGTGGAIRLACADEKEENVVVSNGDTLFRVNVQAMAALHTEKKAQCTLALKPMKEFDRYGVVELNNENTVRSFKEKQFYTEGLINGGVYILNVPAFMNKPLPERFSFEKDFLERYYSEGTIFGLKDDAYFIDIGIPEDYERAGVELQSPAL